MLRTCPDGDSGSNFGLSGFFLIVVMALALSAETRASNDNKSPIALDIRAQSLADALHQLADQAGLQLLYDSTQLSAGTVIALNGNYPVESALRRLLLGTGMQWRFINGTTIAIYKSSNNPAVGRTMQKAAPVASATVTRRDDIALLPDLLVTAGQVSLSGSSSRVLGFDMSLLEAPRSVSLVNSETIEQNSLSAVEDLMRLLPGVFTTTRFGIQGSVDVRGVPADTYFRGMKRLTLQGHGRSVLAAMDSIEVVSGPAAPLYGLGKMGGYTNVVPKSGRARSGGYLTESQGFVQVIGGQYDRRELSAGLGGPVSSLYRSAQGGYYLYGLIEDSGSYARGVPVKQQLFQGATSIDNAIGNLRLETGVNFQMSRTAGALVGRVTQDLVDQGRYISGSPLVNLDLNGNGTIGYTEMNRASPVLGSLNANNQPLNQVFAWPTDANGKPLAADQFPQRAGIPSAMYDYLQAHPENDPTGVLRAQGRGGVTPISGQVPVGMVLDPATVTIRDFDARRSSAFERDAKAEFLTAYFDLISDTNPDFTFRNQLFFDSMRQHKSSNQPFSQVQDVQVIEDRMTLTRRLNFLPTGFAANLLVTANARDTVSRGKISLADYGNHRTDAMAPGWNTSTAGMTANTTFTSANDNTDLANDGLPWLSLYRTEFDELGAGVMLDVSLPRGWRVVTGARMDGSRASNTNYAGRFNINTGTANNPGAYITSDEVAQKWDRGASWSASLTKQLPYGLYPYVTAGRSTLMLDGNNNSLITQIINAGHIGYADIKEAGLKGEWLQGRMNLAVSAFEQKRAEVNESDDINVLTTYASSTTTRGWQSEFKWQPTPQSMLSLYTLRHVTRYTPNVGGTVQVDARFLGFKDVVDASGRVIYPAEAFLYGGRARIVLPAGMTQYQIKQGTPQNQIGAMGAMNFARHWQALLRATYLSSTCSGRLCLVKLPQSLVWDAGLAWLHDPIKWRLDVTNVTDERYFRARTGDTLGDVIAQAMPGRRWQLTANYSF